MTFQANLRVWKELSQTFGINTPRLLQLITATTWSTVSNAKPKAQFGSAKTINLVQPCVVPQHVDRNFFAIAVFSSFEEVTQNVDCQMQTVQQAAKRALQHRYPGAFRRTPKVPNAYALPKRKKDLQAGRPIVFFVEAFLRPLLEDTACLLHHCLPSRLCQKRCLRPRESGPHFIRSQQLRIFCGKRRGRATRQVRVWAAGSNLATHLQSDLFQHEPQPPLL